MTGSLLSRRAALVSALALLAAAPVRARSQTAPAATAPLAVAASFSILGDLVRQIAGARAQVAVLVGPGEDVHAYQPTPADLKAVAAAKLVFENGLGLEGWLGRLAGASGGSARRVVVSAGVAPRREEEGGHDHDKGGSGHDKGGSGHGDLDPHAWQNVANVKIYVANIRDALAGADPAGGAEYEAAAKTFTQALDRLDADIRAGVGALPAARRKIVTTHDAFGYFGAAYGLEILSPSGVAPEAEISARDVARIVAQIKRDKVPAVFLENVADPRLMERIARETGARVGGKLYSDALGPADGPAGTYVSMMRSNLATLTQALAP